MTASFWQKKIIGEVKVSWIAIIIGFYFFLYVLYVATLTYNESGYMDYSKRTFTDMFLSYARAQTFDYLFKFLLTIPLCYLYFKWIANWRLTVKMVLHLFTMVLFVFVWKNIFYFTMESFGWGHLRGTAQVWDIYIPALFYVIQFGFFHAFEYYYQLQKQKELEHTLRQVSLQNELSAIKAQLNPHFLYNVFNTISASVPPEQERTREMIAELSDLFRYQLKASRTELVPLKDEIEFVQKYLDLEKARFGERLTVNIDIDNAVLDEKIPSMILQPLVENCLKHGLSSLVEGGEISINIKKEADSIHFEIADTGIGVKDKSNLLKGEGIGLQNTQLRLEKMYHSKLLFSDNPPMGLIVRFDLNTNNISKNS